MKKPKYRAANHKILQRKAGSKPGSLFVPAEAFAPRYFLISFNEQHFEETEFADYEQLHAKINAHPDRRYWVDIRGYNDAHLMEKIARDFGIHTLQLEDVLNDYQRPKVEETEDDNLFIVSRMLRWSDAQQQLHDVQLSIFTGQNYVLTLQSDYEDCLDPLRERIRVGKGIIRHRPTMYLAYAMVDVVLDYYFPVMATISNLLDEQEQEIILSPSKKNLFAILNLKNQLAKLRRIVWPERDKINELLRMDEPLMPDSMKVYFRDAYDHVIQLIDLVDNHKEMTSSLVDLYTSTMGNRMNEIMKVLTMISTIFIPLSFIVGLYGMNFSRENPETGRVYPFSMPELYQPYAYPVLLGLMFLLVTLQVYFFYRKGWFRSM